MSPIIGAPSGPPDGIAPTATTPRSSRPRRTNQSDTQKPAHYRARAAARPRYDSEVPRMNRQNLFSDAWDGENEEAATRHRIFWRPDDARMGATLYELAPDAPETRMHMHFGAERC